MLAFRRSARRSIAVAVVSVVMCGLSVGCATGNAGATVELHVSPGEGTVRITDSESGGETVCAVDCTRTYPRGTRVELELSWPRDTRVENEAIGLTRDVAVRGEWDDRSGHRAAGAILLLGGLGAAAAMWGSAFVILGAHDFGSVFGFALLGSFGSIVGLVALVFGPYLLGLEDRPVLVRTRLPVSRERPSRALATPWLVPLEGGALVGLALRL